MRLTVSFEKKSNKQLRSLVNLITKSLPKNCKAKIFDYSEDGKDYVFKDLIHVFFHKELPTKALYKKIYNQFVETVKENDKTGIVTKIGNPKIGKYFNPERIF